MKIKALAHQYWPTAALFAALLVIWQLAVSLTGIREYLLPAPASVWHQMWQPEVPWAQHLLATTWEIIGAFFLAAIVGVLMATGSLRLGDVVDDYCPRERRIANHVIVAIVEDQIRQTRCTTCDAEHEYKHAKVPRPRASSRCCSKMRSCSSSTSRPGWPCTVAVA